WRARPAAATARTKWAKLNTASASAPQPAAKQLIARRAYERTRGKKVLPERPKDDCFVFAADTIEKANFPRVLNIFCQAINASPRIGAQCDLRISPCLKKAPESFRHFRE